MAVIRRNYWPRPTWTAGRPRPFWPFTTDPNQWPPSSVGDCNVMSSAGRTSVLSMPWLYWPVMWAAWGGGSYFNIASSRNFTPFAHKYGEYGRRLLIQDIGREILEADPPVKLIWVDCLNVVNQVPDCGAVARAFEKTDFVVVVEAFMNDTAMRADLILPPVLMMEREDLVGSAMHNYVNYSGKIFDPPPEARTDYEIAALLGRRLDPPILLPGPEECVEQALKNSKTGMSFQEIKARGFARVEYPNPAYENLVFDHPDGKYRFSEELHDRAGDDPDYPLHMLTLVNGKYIHSQIPEEEQNGPPRVMISPRKPHACFLTAGSSGLSGHQFGPFWR